jgi:murein DD-endopeptidase MepM/ murein hydrolase activator NlpD
MRFLITDHGPIQISSRFGARESFRDKPHTGIDLSMPEGTELHSIGEGVVERIVDYGKENIGQGIIVKMEDGTRAIYGHMSEIDVKPGQHVGTGDLLGLSGNTGHSTGPHLHLGLWKDGEYVDPTPMADLVKDSAVLDGSKGPALHLWDLLTGRTNVEEIMRDKTQEVLWGLAQGLQDFLLEASFAIALVGGGLCILLKVVGWDQGYKWAGILLLANTLIRYLLG